MKHRKSIQPAPIDDSQFWAEGPDSAVGRFFKDKFVRACLRGQQLTDREYATYFLDGINRRMLSVPEWLRLLGGMQTVADPAGEDENDPVLIDMHLIIYFENILSKIVALRDVTASPAQRTAARAEVEAAYFKVAPELDERIVIVPHVIPLKSGLLINPQIIGYSSKTMLYYAFAMLLSKFSNDLQQCQWRRCNDFFLVDTSKGKSQQRRYCREEHRNGQLNDERADRVHATRAGMTADEWRSVKVIDSAMTPKIWKELKAARPSLTVKGWLSKQAKAASK